MDPLSITASTIALISVCQQLAQGFQVLVQLSHVPEEIESLVDELQDFRNALGAVYAIARRRATLDGLEDCSDDLKALLLKAGNIFTSIASHCGITVANNPSVSLRETQSNLDLLTRFRWLKDKKKICNYRSRLKIIRLDIANHLASLSLVDSSSVLVELRGLTSTLRKLSVDHSELHTTLSTINVQSKDSGASVNAHSSSHFSPCLENARDVSRSSSSSSISKAVDGKKSSCLSCCSCSCHQVTSIAIPAAAETFFGCASISFQGVSYLNPSCNEVTCRKARSSTIKIAYRFPWWLMRRGLNSALYTSHLTGSQLALSTTRVVSRSSDIFCYAMDGDILGIQKLFSDGSASPFDVSDDYGYTALHYATVYGHIELCSLLLRVGARRDITDFDNHTSTDIAYHKTWTKADDDSAVQELQSLFDEETWLEEKQLTTLHKMVLGLISTRHSLSDELSVSTRQINAPDADGRTPLSWAAELGDQASVSILLEYGGNPEQCDKLNNTPLHYACKSPNPDVVSILLSAGACPIARNKHGQTPLNWAAFHQNDPTFGALLFDQPGVDLNDIDSHGCPLLGCAAFSSNDNMLSYLLDMGADPNAVAVDGTTCLLDCISMNVHATLGLLLSESAKYRLDLTYRDFSGEHCLHYLARRADVETAKIFLHAVEARKVDCTGLDANLVGEKGLSVRDLLKLRGQTEVERIMEEALVTIEREQHSQNIDGRYDEEFVDALEILA